MKQGLIHRYRESFEKQAKHYKGIECWSARDLQQLMGYEKWSNFTEVLSKAMESCKNSKQEPQYHFADAGKMVGIGSGAERKVEDYFLTRYACYLVAQNGDPRKEVIAFAQSYFALQTRKQEVLEERILLQERLHARAKLSETEKRLSEHLYQRGVDEQGFANIRSKGDTALFGGYSTNAMKKKLKIASGALADHLPTITIKAKDFATELTNFNVDKEDMHGEPTITTEHVKNNCEVRTLLGKRGIKPEELRQKKTSRKSEATSTSITKKLPSDLPKFPPA